MIEVKLFAYLRDNRGKSVMIEYHEGLTIEDVILDLGIDVNRVSITLINGRHKTLDTVLKDNDKLFLFPPVGGG